jgi:type IV secretion system protein VirB10
MPTEASEYERQNLTGSKLAFAGPMDKSGPIYADRGGVVGSCVVRAGWTIPAVLVSALNSSVPGNVTARVRENVYDTDTGKCLAIPQNSILLGQFNSQTTLGQGRLQVKWTQLAIKGRPTIALDGMPATDADGSAGVKGHVNNHYRRIVGFAALSSLFAAGIQISQNRGTGSTLVYPSAGQVAGAAVGQQLGQFGEQMTERNLIPPVIEKPAGYRFDVGVDRDMIFDQKEVANR